MFVHMVYSWTAEYDKSNPKIFFLKFSAHLIIFCTLKANEEIKFPQNQHDSELV